jgi:uncharacterized protein (TIGR00255 family)
MTGYGQGSAEGAGIRVTVELRGVNNRFTDLRLKVPSDVAPMEAAIRRRIQGVVRRGRVEMRLSLERTDPDDAPAALNRSLVRSIVGAARDLQNEFGVRGGLDLTTVLSLPGIIDLRSPERNLSDEEREAIEAALGNALEALERERLREGKVLSSDLLERLSAMEKLLPRLRARAGEVPAEARRKLLERVETLAEGVELDPARLAQEAAFLADRCDVTEELVRLEGHLGQVRALLAEPDGGPVGKRLDFLLQEVHREINTVSSKSADLELSRLALSMRAEAEKVREQIQNLE